MAEFREDVDVYPTMIQLAGCIELQLEDSGLPGVCRNGVEPGAEVAFDVIEKTEDKDGQAFVRLVTAFPSSSFPQPDEGGSPCSGPLAYVLEVGIVRCGLMVEDEDELPTAEDVIAASRLQMADIAALRRAIICCLAANDDLEHAMGTYEPYGPLGGLVGGSWTVTVGSARG